MASATLTARLVGDAKSLVDSFDRGEQAAGGFGATLGKVSQIAGGFVLANGIMRAPGVLMDMAKGAAEDAASLTRLKQAVENSGAAWSTLEGSMTAQIELAQKRAFTDDQARSSLALLVAQTGSAEEAQKRFALAMDLSRGAGIDLETASKLLGKVTEENVSVLRRYGINIEKGASAAELFGAVQQKFGGQSEAFAKSAAGQGEAVAIAMAEAQESIGYLLMPAMVALTGVLSTAVIPAIAFLTRHADILGPALAGIGTAIAAVLVPATWAYVSALTAQAVAFVAANAPIIAVGVAIAALVAGIIIAVRHWDDITAAAGRFADYVRDRVVGAFEAVAGGIRGAVNWAIDGINNLIRAWNQLEFNISIPFGPSFSVGTPDLPEIPRMASGGIVTRPTLALIGEAGPEAVVPLGRGGMGGNVYHFHFPHYVGSHAELEEAMLAALTQAERKGRLTRITVPGTVG